MKSERPKVLHPVAGQPMVLHVLAAVQALRPRGLGVVIGHAGGQVRATLSQAAKGRVHFVVQRRQRGSGDAVRAAAAWLRRQGGETLVLYGDSPLLRPETLQRLVGYHRQVKPALTLLSTELTHPGGYGRLIRGPAGHIERIVEEQEANPQERAVQEINVGVWCFDTASLLKVLPRLQCNNAKREYYLTDCVALLRQAGGEVQDVACADSQEALGVNSQQELAHAEMVLRQRTVTRLMAAGVTVTVPALTFVDAGVTIGADSVLWPGTMILGCSQIGRHCHLGPNAFIQDSVLGDGVEVRSSFLYEARVEREARIGPFAHLRQGSWVGPGARIGNFVELKQSRIGRETKVSHLSYVGNSEVGEEVNMGAGVITCNYDGFRKSRTVIGAKSFIGSNVNLIAPVRIGAGAVVGAGSTVTEDVPPEALAIARSRQIVKLGWAKAQRRNTQRVGRTGRSRRRE